MSPASELGYGRVRLASGLVDWQVKLDLNDGQWLSSGQKASLVAGDTIIVVYDVPDTEDAQQLGVWPCPSAMATRREEAAVRAVCAHCSPMHS